MKVLHRLSPEDVPWISLHRSGFIVCGREREQRHWTTRSGWIHWMASQAQTLEPEAFLHAANWTHSPPALGHFTSQCGSVSTVVRLYTCSTLVNPLDMDSDSLSRELWSLPLISLPVTICNICLFSVTRVIIFACLTQPIIDCLY